MKKPNLENLPKEAVEYIEYLEIQIDGSNSLVDELNIISGVIASEIKETRLKGSILEDDKKFDKVLQLIEKAAKIKALSTKKEDEPKGKESEVETVTTTTVKQRRNIQDFVIKNNG